MGKEGSEWRMKRSGERGAEWERRRRSIDFIQAPPMTGMSESFRAARKKGGERERELLALIKSRYSRQEQWGSMVGESDESRRKEEE